MAVAVVVVAVEVAEVEAVEVEAEAVVVEEAEAAVVVVVGPRRGRPRRGTTSLDGRTWQCRRRPWCCQPRTAAA